MHKSTIKSFNKYVDSLGNDIDKLNKFNNQLNSLSKTINTPPRLFKSFTSQKRSNKIKQTTKFKQALLPEFIDDHGHDKPIKIRKSKLEKNK